MLYFTSCINLNIFLLCRRVEVGSLKSSSPLPSFMIACLPLPCPSPTSFSSIHLYITSVDVIYSSILLLALPTLLSPHLSNSSLRRESDPSHLTNYNLHPTPLIIVVSLGISSFLIWSSSVTPIIILITYLSHSVFYDPSLVLSTSSIFHNRPRGCLVNLQRDRHPNIIDRHPNIIQHSTHISPLHPACLDSVLDIHLEYPLSHIYFYLFQLVTFNFLSVMSALCPPTLLHISRLCLFRVHPRLDCQLLMTAADKPVESDNDITPRLKYGCNRKYFFVMNTYL